MPHEPDPSETPASQRLTNDDFRRLLMTPRATPSGAPGGPSAPGTIREAMSRSSTSMAPPDSTPAPATPSIPSSRSEDRYEQRRKRKSFYAKLKKQEDDKMAELAEKYRDRARERRDGANPDYASEEAAGGAKAAAAAAAAAAAVAATASAYRAVAPDIKSGLDAAERRKQLIQESKFLGGDMEHTHLVKGLDYALLQKVRSEIQAKEYEQEQELERLAQAVDEPPPPKKSIVKAPVAPEPQDEMQFRTKLGRSIHRTVMQLRSRHIERSELFVPGRMAYVVDLDDDADTDIPTTLIRSKAEVPSLNATPTLTTNDIVINKLAQILSYLRAGRRGKKGKGRLPPVPTGGFNDPEPTTTKGKNMDDSIYGDIGDYVPSNSRANQDEETRRTTKHRYFADDDEDDAEGDYNERSQEIRVGVKEGAKPPGGTRSHQLLTRLTQQPEGYAECYPGLEEMQDAIDDSDDEVDYSKMDLGKSFINP